MSTTMTQSDIEDAEFLGRKSQSRDVPLTIECKALAAALSRASGAIGRSNTIPILNCILLRVEDGILTLDATNMELAIRQEIPVTGNGRHAGCVNAALLTGVTGRLPPDAMITMEFTTAALVLRSGRSRVSLAILPADEYPTFSRGTFATQFTMKCAELALMLERTRPFMSNEMSRQYLCGVHMSVDHGALRFAATTSNDLCDTSMTLPEGAAEAPSIIIPAPSIVEMAKMATGVGDIAISVSDTRVVCEVAGLTMISKLIDGTFPAIERVIPRSNSNILRVHKADLTRALGLAALISDGPTPWVRLILEDGTVKITSGHGAEEIVCELPEDAFTYEGVDLSMAFWTKSFIEPTKLVDKTIEFQLADGVPFLARDADDHSATYVAMSIRR